MPIKRESILNDECTEAIEEIYQCLNKARELYEALPQCLKNEIRELNGFGETLPYCLNKGVAAVECTKKHYGMR